MAGAMRSFGEGIRGAAVQLRQQGLLPWQPGIKNVSERGLMCFFSARSDVAGRRRQKSTFFPPFIFNCVEEMSA